MSDDSKPGLGKQGIALRISHGHKLYKCVGVLPSDTVDIKKRGGPPFPEGKKIIHLLPCEAGSSLVRATVTATGGLGNFVV